MLGNEVMSKEQCYDLYQQILGVKKFEHQLLYNAMQVSPNIFCNWGSKSIGNTMIDRGEITLF